MSLQSSDKHGKPRRHASHPHATHRHASAAHAGPARKGVRSEEDANQGDKAARTAHPAHPTRAAQIENAKELEEELSKMETELGAVQEELVQVQREREVLEEQRRVLKAVAPPPGLPPLPGPPGPPGAPGVPGPTPPARGSARDNTDRPELELQQRQGHGGHGTFTSPEGWETRGMELEKKLRALESQKFPRSGTRDAALATLRQKYDEAQDELREMRTLIEDQAGHLEGYRNKYLVAQQQVEEQRRHLEQVETEQDRLSEQVQAELHRVKTEFEERLQELALLPDILKATQGKMQEEKQLRLMAEHNCADLNHELASALETLAANDKDMNSLRTQHQSMLDERQTLLSHVDAHERKCSKLNEEIKWYKQGMAQLEQVVSHSERLYEDTVLELARVRGELDAYREQTARQTARLRDQMDTMRRSFHTQIGELEQQLAASRASANAAHKEKEEFQQRLQMEVANMNQSFSQAQERIKNLQHVVDVLKNNVLGASIDKVSIDAIT